MIRRPPRSTLSSSSAASDVYKRQYQRRVRDWRGAAMVKFNKDLTANKKEKWNDHYLRYKDMKVCLDSGSSAETAAQFDALYQQSLDIVNSFFNTKIAEFDEALSRYDSTPQGPAADDAERSFFATFREVGDFQTYVWLNATGFRKIMKKYDKRMGLRGSGAERQMEMEKRLLLEPFLGSQLEAILARAKQHGHVNPSHGSQRDLKLVAGSGNPELAEEISGRLGIPLLKTDIKRFNDGECSIKLLENVRGDDVYVIQPTCSPVNDNLMELLLTISALKRASVHYVIAVVPYYGYARMDRKAGSRVPISAADVAKMLEAMGVDRVIAIDLHAGQIQGFFGPTTPVDNLFAGPVALQYFQHKNLERPVVISPDAGGVARAKEFKEGLHDHGMAGVTMAMIIKQRAGDGVVGSADLVGDVDGRDCIIVDDIIDTAGTLCAAANELKAFGAKRVFAFATHGLFNGPAPQRINDCVLEEVVVTNTVPLAESVAVACSKIRVLSVGKLLSETIRRVHSGESLATMFETVKAGTLCFASGPCPTAKSPAGAQSEE
eukprot:TRINITY_DN2580_c0_g1_i2.p1 TRINITY_DN2580_c0_g1~~TRINITY_DN2580_c0_g1_i2.p1  ORF type:complete len:549 (-),score=147.74 TRINITY_DN2580_c0_g1_i2:180-1826(-)